MEKTCNKCGETKPIEQFGKNYKMADGHLNQCKVCVSAYRKKYYKENRGEIRENQRQRYLEDESLRIKAQERAKEWAKENPDKRREILVSYRRNNREKINEQNRVYRRRNHEEILKRERCYRAENKERIKKQQLKYTENQIKNIGEWYVKNLLCRHTNELNFGNIPRWLIDLQREQINLHRLIKKIEDEKSD